ncbi:DNA alkylation repair protein [Paenibacillus sp. 598K]|uniref:DNA alkylation repair protein n=1 Tax=Paenibacillus sp. 598K TaxID=1117987 RepID=UPI000FF9804E|nr:DNA alkylation repair protein [Paenibacillus sp. 598K]GBF73442.1 DNA alkylation repair protein [Paenibacillus sp. 598K]
MSDYRATLEERYAEQVSFKLIEKDAEQFYAAHALEDCYTMGQELYQSGNYQVQEAGVYLLGYAATANDKALLFLKEEVSRHDNWRVQEVLAKAFDRYCSLIGYETALPIIKDWLASDIANTRRAVSEGLRIWTGRPYFKEHPQLAIDLLAAHKEDESLYMRKSVGNALRDISKKHPALIAKELEQWNVSSKEIKQVYKLASKFIAQE